MDKRELTIDDLIHEAEQFCAEEPQYDNPALFGVTDGTYIEHKFQDRLQKFDYANRRHTIMKEALRQLTAAQRECLQHQFGKAGEVDTANEWLAEACGVRDFFEEADAFRRCRELLTRSGSVREKEMRREYGDYQTPPALTDAICAQIARSGTIKHVVEPTFGKGSFLHSAVKHFPELESVHGVEIYEPHVWHAKFALLAHGLEHPEANKPSIHLWQRDVFAVDFADLAHRLSGKIAVLGNPPWVTNAELGTLGSDNVPVKSNFKNHSGLDALTGKSNFDLSEYILLMMFRAFGETNGQLAMLTKNSVVQNLIRDLPDYDFGVSDAEALSIDAKKHFGASVAASLFRCEMEWDDVSPPQCRVAAFDAPGDTGRRFGWVGDKFVSDVNRYEASSHFDGASPFTWRQGLKHDCARVMELEPMEDGYRNKLGEEMALEEDLLFSLLKSSDLKQPVASQARKVVIVTQEQVGQPTQERLAEYPKLSAYLQNHRDLLDARGSSIYDGKPPYSIFGIGEYAFAPYKVAVSGFYKKPNFSLVTPHHDKPVMLDDTGYYVGFERLPDALFTWALLNGARAQRLLQSLTFTDAKRPYTKTLLMRVDLARLAHDATYMDLKKNIMDLKKNIAETAPQFEDCFCENDWLAFKETMQSAQIEDQLTLFG